MSALPAFGRAEAYVGYRGQTLYLLEDLRALARGLLHEGLPQNNAPVQPATELRLIDPSGNRLTFSRPSQSRN
jgi:hypothetical protein